MQFQFRADQALQPDKDGFAFLQGQQLAQKLKNLKTDHMRQIAEIITSMGTASAKAQALKQIITTFEKFVGTDNRIYFKVDGNKVLGLLRVGEKNLFYRDYVLDS
jgi:alpha-tubulin N-acetyltransferase 1